MTLLSFSVSFCPGRCSETLIFKFRDGAETCGRHWDTPVSGERHGARPDFALHLPEPR